MSNSAKKSNAENIVTPLTEGQIQNLADELLDYLVEHNLFDHCRIYFNGKCYQDGFIETETYNASEVRMKFPKSEKSRPYTVFVLEDISPQKYLGGYAGDILSISTFGELYSIINCLFEEENLEIIYSEIDAIFEKYGLGYELGYQWCLSAFYISSDESP